MPTYDELKKGQELFDEIGKTCQEFQEEFIRPCIEKLNKEIERRLEEKICEESFVSKDQIFDKVIKKW